MQQSLEYAEILDHAVRGKLVPQDPNDEPASVFLEMIRADKQKLVKAGKIKKEKNPSEIHIASDGSELAQEAVCDAHISDEPCWMQFANMGYCGTVSGGWTNLA